MDTRSSSEHPLERQRTAARALDESVHARLARASMGLSPISLALAHADWALHLSASPGRQMVLAQRVLDLTQQAWQATWAGDGAPAEQDTRFADPAWRQWPFSALKEGFKACDAWWREAAQLDGMSRHHQHMVSFFTRQTLDALSPSNWAPSNPEVLRQARDTQGQSLRDGWANFGEDLLERKSARPDAPPEAIPPLPYAVGRDVAVTPGKVVFRNHLIELIRYAPVTAKVYPEPLLIVPSCIMKYYILDLSPANSMVRYLVGQGHTVFIVSWRNPDASDRDLGMQDYLRMGVMEAMAAVRAQTGAPRIHALGYCLGGTFLSIVAAALARSQGDARPAARGGRRAAPASPGLPELATVTLLAAQTDFSEPGELGVFIDDDQLKTLRESMARTGYLSGRQMAGSFQFLNSRDLVWSRATRRYLLGQDEVGNDMMSWNADTTRLPARMHSEYLSSLFLNNALASGQYRVDGEGVALRDIQAPMFVVGTVRDHVSPWRSVYKIHLLTDAPITFVLAAGGHNAGIVSEPGHPRRSYQIASSAPGDEWLDPDAWQAGTPVLEGSWWTAMHEWLRERSGKPVAARPIDAATALCDAPGQYVMTRYAD
ncbi:PHA/PHB synthase family protein [Paenacidovorax monticola]|uniref:Polyhydroxyalkanoic acid synthase n=1 Tax=Paenacidovorax monticola TaxID=1926868 RepID=A0A7H0HE20_9BURK|nr:alpha/beta fold hydrolase [Paenacidovorax monticola]QNP58786.1 polyhydroxyalkanoic acid synthase [Paenacidovorax monticola]